MGSPTCTAATDSSSESAATGIGTGTGADSASRLVTSDTGPGTAALTAGTQDSDASADTDPTDTTTGPTGTSDGDDDLIPLPAHCRDAGADPWRIARIAVLGRAHICAIRCNGRARCWGRKAWKLGDHLEGERILGESEHPRETPPLDTEFEIADMAGEACKRCILTWRGEVICWGTAPALVYPDKASPIGKDESFDVARTVAVGRRRTTVARRSADRSRRGGHGGRDRRQPRVRVVDQRDRCCWGILKVATGDPDFPKDKSVGLQLTPAAAGRVEVSPSWGGRPRGATKGPRPSSDAGDGLRLRTAEVARPLMYAAARDWSP